MPEIDYYRESDFQELCRLINQWDSSYPFNENIIRESIKNIIEETGNKIIIAKVNGVVTGYAQVAKCCYLGFKPFAEIIQLLVSENNRSSGIGNAIMIFIENEMIKENIHTLKLSSQVHRSRSHVFYERLGYSYFKISKFYEKHLNSSGEEVKQ